MTFGLFEILTILGSLGLFIYGMKVMSEGIQKVAGSKMRQILSAMTSNRFKGILTGFLITSMIQSSSATTVMVVSFVNAGLLSLLESIGVIMGANIGTTITAWLISIIGFKVKISAAALPIIAFGFPLMFFKSSRAKAWGETIIGFAVLFLGLEFLKSSVPDLRANPQILEFLSAYTDMGIISVILFVFIGTLMTIIIQSSSATMALTLVMANNGWIPFELAAAMVLGENVGTTITANIAAIVGNVYAKRAARAHLIFNLFGVVWMLFLLNFFISGIDKYMTAFNGISPLDPDGAAAIPVALSIFHSSFNIINTVVLVGFSGFIARIVTQMVPSKGDDAFRLEYIGSGFIRTPDLSILEARKEIAKFGEITARMSASIRALIFRSKPRIATKLMDKVQQYEEITDRVEVEVANYLSKVAEGNITENTSRKLRALLSINSDLEEIGDIFFQMSLSVQRKKESKLWFSDKQLQNLNDMFNLLDEAFDIMKNNLEANYEKVSKTAALEKEREINAKRSELRREHLANIEKGHYDVMGGIVYSDLFTSMEKIGDLVYNVTLAITGELS